jgi:hypothetical protein
MAAAYWARRPWVAQVNHESGADWQGWFATVQLSVVGGKVRSMESGQGSLVELRSTIGAVDAQAFVRVAVAAGSQAVWHVDAIVSPPSVPAGWQPLVWRYEHVTFIAAEVSVESLLAALSTEAPQVLSLGGHDAVFPSLSDQFTWQRKPSRARFDSMVLPWPTYTCSLREPNSPQQQTPQGYLIGDDCPSFPRYDDAFRAFFYGDFSRSPGGQVPSEFAILRVVEGRAWIERVLITPISLEVSVSGSDISGIRVELNSATYRADARVTEVVRVLLPLPGGLPPNAWLYLSQDKQWLDYRAIGEYAQAELERAGVEIELPYDPEAEIQALLSQGEGQQVEFKSQLPQDTTESKRTVFKTVAAFANGYGGNMVFGVEKDEATVCGLASIDPLRERDRLAQLVRAIVTPAPEVEVRQYDVDGKVLLVLSVEAGANRPYGITLPGRKDKPVEFYVRRDATTFPATAHEVRNAVLAAAPQPVADTPWGYRG